MTTVVRKAKFVSEIPCPTCEVAAGEPCIVTLAEPGSQVLSIHWSHRQREARSQTARVAA